MADFEQLCKHIIDSDGNPSVKNVLDCGYSMENFIRLCQPWVRKEVLVKRAKENLLERGIHYKEEN